MLLACDVVFDVSCSGEQLFSVHSYLAVFLAMRVQHELPCICSDVTGPIYQWRGRALPTYENMLPRSFCGGLRYWFTFLDDDPDMLHGRYAATSRNVVLYFTVSILMEGVECRLMALVEDLALSKYRTSFVNVEKVLHE